MPQSAFFLLLIRLQTALQVVYKAVYVFVVRIRVRERIAFVIKKHVEGLCISAKLRTLQVTPLVANRAKRCCLAIPLLDHRFISNSQYLKN